MLGIRHFVSSGVALFAVMACVANGSSIFIRGVLAPAECTYTADPQGPYLSSGRVDVAFATQYSPGILVANQLVKRGSPDQLRTETNRFQMQGVVVRITDAAGGALSSYTTQTSALIDPASGGEPGYAAAGAILVDPATLDGLRATLSQSLQIRRIISFVKVFGTTLGGQYIESAEFAFPIDVCFGCLVTFPPGTDDSAIPGADCKGTPTSTTTTAPCLYGQDQEIPCNLCSTSPVCQP